MRHLLLRLLLLVDMLHAPSSLRLTQVLQTLRHAVLFLAHDDTRSVVARRMPT